MAQCKLNKITAVCERWKRDNQSETAMTEIQKIVDLKESEMPPCTCNKQKEMPKASGSCPIKSSPNTLTGYCNKQKEMPKESGSCPTKNSSNMCTMQESRKESVSCPTKEDGNENEEKSGSCHNSGPMTINPFFNFMKELRETNCFNRTVVEVSKEAGSKWKKMSECEKAPYIVEAYKVSRKKGDGAMKRQNSKSSMSEPKSKVKRLDCPN